jgi:hypothetical protein
VSRRGRVPHHATGKSLQELIDALLRWTTVTLPAVERARAHFDDHT